MTTAIRSNQIQDDFGRPVPGASIYVYNLDGSLATLTSDGTTHLDNPLTSDAFGNYQYYALVGYYREDVWFGGKLRWSENNVAVGSPGADLNLRSDLAASGGSALVGTAHAGTISADLDAIYGTTVTLLASGSSQQLTQQRTVTGAVDGSSVFYGTVSRVQATGANPLTEVRTNYFGLDVDTTALVATAIGEHRYVWVGSSGSVTNLRVFEGHVRADSSGGVISTAIVYNIATPTFNSGTGFLTKLVGFGCADLGDATRVGTAVGIEIPDFTAGPSLSVAFWGQTTPGANKYALYMSGGANNYLSGPLGIGTLAPDALLHIRKDVDGLIGPIVQNRNATGTPKAAIRFITGVNDLADNRYAAVASSGGATCDLEFQVSNGTGPYTAWQITPNGGLVPQTAADTSMTNGFLRIHGAAGAPTGVPSSITGTVPLYYDTTNNKLYVYNGAWKGVTLA